MTAAELLIQTYLHICHRHARSSAMVYAEREEIPPDLSASNARFQYFHVLKHLLISEQE